MSSTRVGISGILAAIVAGLTACQGVVMPGRTAGDTWGGRSPFVEVKEPKKEEPKKEEKKDEKKAEKPKDPPTPPGPYDRPGFITREEKGRLWVFREGSKELKGYLKGGEPAVSATLVGDGPNGMSLRGPNMDTIEAYVASRPGFEVWVKEGRYWVFKAGSKDAAEFAKGGEPAKSVTLVGEAPDGRSVRAPDVETAEAFVLALRQG